LMKIYVIFNLCNKAIYNTVTYHIIIIWVF